ncbi:MAG: secretin N-terminal domain-containing protein [Myxococcota bacterium]
MRTAAALVIVVAWLGAAATPRAAAAPRDDAPRIAMRFQNANLPQILDRIAPQLGSRFIYDTSLSGRVTISLARPVTVDEAWELLHAALAMRGFALAPIPAGGFKVVALAEAQASDPFRVQVPTGDGESRLVTLLDVQHADAAELRDVIAPLLDAHTLAVALPATNALLVATTERRLAAIARLVRAIDADARDPLRLRTLRERDASFVFGVLDARYGEGSGAAHPVELWVDERTNAVLYRAPSALADEIESTLDALDHPVRGSGELAILRLQHADPTAVVEALQALAAAPGGVGPGEGSGLAGARLNVVAEPATASIVVNAAPEVVERVRALVAALDRPPRQIAVDALVQEWSYSRGFDFELSAASEFGLDGDAIGAVTVLPAGDLAPALEPSDALAIDVVRGLSRLVVVANANDVVASTLMRPHLLALNGEEQVIFSGDNVPVPVAAPAQNDRDQLLRQRTTIERRDVGIELRVRPTIGSEYGVELEVEIEIEAVGAPLVDAAQGPTFQQRTIHTVAQLRSGAAVAIATPVQLTRTTTHVGIPFLRDLPVLGRLFDRTIENERRTRLVIAVQATPLPDSDALAAYGIRRRVAFERALAREEVLAGAPETRAPFALRIPSGFQRDDADALAARLDSELHPARVVAWRDVDRSPSYDVQLFGFDRYQDAADEAFRLFADGLRAEVVPLAAAGDAIGGPPRAGGSAPN